MATQTGIDAVVKLGTVEIADMATWSFTDEKAPITAPVFGETFNKVHGMGIRNVTGSVTGYLNTSDSTGQILIQTAYEAGTALSDFRVYINDTQYWLGTSVYISNFNTSATAEDAVIPISFDFTASENWTFVTT
jgi:hypothetical protein